MKIFEIVLFVLTIISAICSENVDTRLSDNEQEVLLNQGEYYPDGVTSNDKHNEYDNRDQFGYKIETNKYSEPTKNVQYMIIKRTHDGPLPKKYGMAYSSTEMTTYHNKQPSKIAYSVAHAHKPKSMPVKVVQEGSVKHIYLDMPNLFDDGKTPKTYDNVNQAASNNHFQFNNFNPGQQGQNFYRPSVQYTPAPSNINAAASGISQQDFNTISSGYKIGKTNQNNPLEDQQYAGEYSSPSEYVSNIYPVEAQYGSQEFGNSGHSSVQTPQFVPSPQSGYSHPQFPQFSKDGKERYTYEIPDQYKSLFSNNNNAYATKQYGQSQVFSPHVEQNQPTYDFGKAQNQQTYDFGKTQNQQQINDFGKPQNEQAYNLNKHQTQQTFDFGNAQNQQQTYDFGNPQTQQTFNFGKQGSQQTFDFGKDQNQHQPYNFGKSQTQQTIDFGKPETQQTFGFNTAQNQQQIYGFGKQQNSQTFDFAKQQTPPIFDYSKAQNQQQIYDYSKQPNPQSANFGKEQTYDFGKTQNEQTYDFGKSARTGKISGFDPNLVNIVNDVLNKDQGQPSSDGFRMSKSNGDKSVYMVGNPSYTFPANSGQPEQPLSQAPTKIKYV